MSDGCGMSDRLCMSGGFDVSDGCDVEDGFAMGERFDRDNTVAKYPLGNVTQCDTRQCDTLDRVTHLTW